MIQFSPVSVQYTTIQCNTICFSLLQICFVSLFEGSFRVNQCKTPTEHWSTTERVCESLCTDLKHLIITNPPHHVISHNLTINTTRLWRKLFLYLITLGNVINRHNYKTEVIKSPLHHTPTNYLMMHNGSFCQGVSSNHLLSHLQTAAPKEAAVGVCSVWSQSNSVSRANWLQIEEFKIPSHAAAVYQDDREAT